MRLAARHGNPRFKYPPGYLTGLAFGRDDERVWTFHRSGAVWGWNRAGEVVASFPVPGGLQSTQVAVDAEGAVAVFARKIWRGPSLMLSAWDLERGQALWSATVDFPDAAVGFSIDRLRLLVAAGARRVVLVGNGRDAGRRYLVAQGAPRALELEPFALGAAGEHWVVWRDQKLWFETLDGGDPVALAGIDAAPRHVWLQSDLESAVATFDGGAVGAWSLRDGSRSWLRDEFLRKDLDTLRCEKLTWTPDALWILEAELCRALDPRSGAELRSGAASSGTSGMTRVVSRSGRWLAQGAENMLSFLDTAGFVRQAVTLEHWSPVCSLAVAPDGRILTAGGTSARVWDRTGRSNPVPAASEVWSPGLVAWSLTGEPVYSTYCRGLWRTDGGFVRELPFVVPTPATAPDGRMNSLVHFRALPDGRLGFALGLEVANAPLLVAVGWNPDRQVVHWTHQGVQLGALTADGRTAFLWRGDGSAAWVDSTSGAVLGELPVDKGLGVPRALAPRSDHTACFALCVAKAAGQDIEVSRLVQVTEAGVVELLGAQGRVHAGTELALSPDEEWLVAAGTGGTLLLWQTRTGALVDELPLEHDAATCLAFALDGRLIAGTERGVVLELEDPRWLPAPTRPCPGCAATLRWVSGCERVRCAGCGEVWQVPDFKPAPAAASGVAVEDVIAPQIRAHLQYLWTRLHKAGLLPDLEFERFEAMAQALGNPGRFHRQELLTILRAHYGELSGPKAVRDSVLVWPCGQSQESVTALHTALERMTGLTLPAPEVVMHEAEAWLRVGSAPEQQYWRAEAVATPFATALQERSPGGPQMMVLGHDGSLEAVAVPSDWIRQGVLEWFGFRPTGPLYQPESVSWY